MLCNRIAPKDPNKPVTTLKSVWESVREEAGVKFRLHDLRHWFCTKFTEAGFPEQTRPFGQTSMNRGSALNSTPIRHFSWWARENSNL
jgi:hypothetical protein